METLIHDRPNSTGYIKCGEILKAEKSFRNQYILRCLECEEIYVLLDSFIFHLNDGCKKNNKIENNIKKDFLYNACEAEVINDPLDYEETPVKFQDENALTMPLVVIKSEHISEDEFFSIKEDLKQHDENATKPKSNDEENISANFEEVYEKDDSMGLFKNNVELDSQSSDEEIENISYTSTTKDGYDLFRQNSNNNIDRTINHSGFVDLFVSKKEHVLAIIKAYENQPCLWDKHYVISKGKIKRKSFWRKISEELNHQHGVIISWKQVANVIVYLHGKYRQDLKNMKEIKEGGAIYTPSWFFKYLNFLNPYVENNPIDRIALHFPDLYPTQIIEILEIYKGFPYLWNSHLVEHYCQNKTYIAKQEMLEALELKMNIKITANILEEYLYSIENYFTRTKQYKFDNLETNIESLTEENYYQHMLFLNEHIGSLFSCNECERTFKSPLSLKVHQSQVHGSDPLSCFQCRKMFKTVTSFKNHVNRHIIELDHGCRECEEKFSNSTESRIHIMLEHTGEKPYHCELCGHSFLKIRSFMRHHKRHTKDILYTCKICNKVYVSKGCYDDHMNTHSNMCNVCGKAFISKETLWEHLATHGDIRYNKIDDNSSKKKTSFYRKMLTSDKVYPCNLCDKTFKHSSSASRHRRIHRINLR